MGDQRSPKRRRERLRSCTAGTDRGNRYFETVNHPHLPSIIDVIDRDDTFLIVMDYIEGKALDYWLKKDGAQPQERVVEWAKQICDVFGYLHSRKTADHLQRLKTGERHAEAGRPDHDHRLRNGPRI